MANKKRKDPAARSVVRGDGVTILTVQCEPGDSGCKFPNCACPKHADAKDRKDFVVGKKVRHFLFGDGVIQCVQASYGHFGMGGLAVDVKFENGKVGKIEATDLSLEKFHIVE